MAVRSRARRCLLLFARSPGVEAKLKRVDALEPLFAAVIGRLRASCRALEDVDLVSAGTAQDPEPFALLQRGSSFGERLTNAVEDARALGYEEIVVVPGDVPGLGRAQLESAFDALRGHELVIGPSPDGGVWLLGLAGDASRLLHDVPWCTSGVRAALLRNARDAALLGELADIDSLAAARALARGAPFALQALLRLCLGATPLHCSPSAQPRLRQPGSELACRGPPAALELAF